MSIRWMRTAQVKGARLPETIAWSKEISAWAHKKYGVTVETWVDSAGTTNGIRWTADYPDMAAFDKTMSAVMMDPEYWVFVTKAMKGELLIDGSGHDSIAKKV